jgi:hypothetical protein
MTISPGLVLLVYDKAVTTPQYNERGRDVRPPPGEKQRQSGYFVKINRKSVSDEDISQIYFSAHLFESMASVWGWIF